MLRLSWGIHVASLGTCFVAGMFQTLHLKSSELPQQDSLMCAGVRVRHDQVVAAWFVGELRQICRHDGLRLTTA